MDEDLLRSVSPAPRLRQACIGCRAIKARCQQTDELVVPCARCKRLKLPCEFTRQKRGRKSNAERERMRDPRSASPRRRYDAPSTSTSTSTSGSSNPHQHAPPRISAPHSHHESNPYSLPGSQRNSVSNAPPQPSTLPQAAVSPVMSFIAGGTVPSADQQPRVEYSPTSGIYPSPLGSTPVAGPPSRTRNRVDVGEYLDPEVEAGNGEAVAPPLMEMRMATPCVRSMEDPVALGIVSVAEARMLVDMFHQHLNPPLALLDPAYHTLAYMHETSPALLTAVLAAAAKFFHGPEVTRSLLDHAQVLINRAVAEGSCEIGMVQCLMVLSHFKATRDRTAWIKIGMALRFAHQLGLHKVVQDEIPANEAAARAQLNLERTWFSLCCFDSTFSNLFLLPLTVPPHERGNVDKWALNHLDLGPASDLRVACSVEFLEVGAQLHALKVNATTKAYRAVILPQLLSEIDRHQGKWFTGRLARLEEHEETALKIGQFSQGLTVRMMLIDDGVDAHRHLAEGLVIGGTVVKWVELIAAHGNLLYCQDTTSVHLARLVVFFHNYFRRLTPQQQSLAVDLMKRLNAACLSVPNMSSDSAPAFVARLIQRVLRALCTRSIAPSRVATPSGGEPNPAEVSEAVMTDLDEFLATITVPDLSTVDDQYWATLFGDTLDQFPFMGDAA